MEVAMTYDYGHLLPDNDPRHLTQIQLKYSFTTAGLHSSGLIVTKESSRYAENPDNWIWQFENRLHWQFEVEKKSTNCCFRLHIYLRTNKTLIHNSLCDK